MPRSNNTEVKAAFTIVKRGDGQGDYHFADETSLPSEERTPVADDVARSFTCSCRMSTFPPPPVPFIATVHGEGSWRTEPTHVKN